MIAPGHAPRTWPSGVLPGPVGVNAAAQVPPRPHTQPLSLCVKIRSRVASPACPVLTAGLAAGCQLEMFSLPRPRRWGDAARQIFWSEIPNCLCPLQLCRSRTNQANQATRRRGKSTFPQIKGDALPPVGIAGARGLGGVPLGINSRKEPSFHRQAELPWAMETGSITFSKCSVATWPPTWIRKPSWAASLGRNHQVMRKMAAE